MKELIAICLTACMGMGATLGGALNAYDDYVYDQALENPNFLYLVDEVGNPVSQEPE